MLQQETLSPDHSNLTGQKEATRILWNWLCLNTLPGTPKVKQIQSLWLQGEGQEVYNFQLSHWLMIFPKNFCMRMERKRNSGELHILTCAMLSLLIARISLRELHRVGDFRHTLKSWVCEEQGAGFFLQPLPCRWHIFNLSAHVILGWCLGIFDLSLWHQTSSSLKETNHVGNGLSQKPGQLPLEKPNL